MKFLNIIENILKDKWSIGYTLKKLGSMIPRQFEFLYPLPIIGYFFMAIQTFWYMVKILFFVTFISWFLPQYKESGAKVALFIIVSIVFFLAWWFICKGNKRETQTFW